MRDINEVWLVIKDSRFEHNKKYLQTLKEIKECTIIDVNISIYDESQLAEIEETMKYMPVQFIINKGDNIWRDIEEVES